MNFTMEQILAIFFKHLSHKISHNTKLSEEISNTLGISKGEAYKKINGKSHLTLSQIKTLCDK